MSKARDTILQRLRAPERPVIDPTGRAYLSRYDWSREERIERFKTRMEAVRTEVHIVARDSWLALAAQLCRDKQLNNLLLSTATPWGQAISAQAEQFPGQFPELKSYAEPIEAWKQEMFYGVDAALTSTLGGIAETGSLILWPDAEEPRLMSLVPPVHIAILEAEQLYSTFAEAVQEQQWTTRGMPTNALLVSGPSKSADIAQVMAYGVHGPKELVVVLLT